MKIKTLMSLALSITVLSLQVTAQSLKTFSGEYDDGEIQPGKATFTYYEDTNTKEFIKHGGFKYYLLSKSDGGNYTLTVTGTYKNNKKEGLWNYVVNEQDYHRTNGYFTGVTKLTSNYLKGLPNGLWSYSSAFKGRNKRSTLNGFVWTPYEVLPVENVVATFKNGTITGNVKFINSPPYSEYNNISGQFNWNGYMDGLWTFTSPEKIKTVLLKNGIVSEFIVRSKSSGKILSKDIDDTEMSKLKSDFLAKRISKEQLKAQGIKIDTLTAVDNNQYDFAMSFNRGQFKHKYFGGDDSYYYATTDNEENANNDGFVDKRFDGSFILFTKAKIYELSELTAYNQLSNNLREGGEEKELVNQFNYFLESYSDNLKSEDLVKVKDEYKKAIYNNRRKNIANRIENADKWLQYNNFKNAIDDYNKILSQSKDDLTNDEAASINLKMKNIQSKLEIANNKENEVNVKKYKINKINANNVLIDNQYRQISTAYGYSANVYNNTGEVKIKKNIFWAYINIYNDFVKRIQSSEDIDHNLKLTEQMVRVQIKALELSRKEDTKEVEKSIKKAKTAEEQLALFN